MSKKSGNVVTDSESSTSQSDDEQKPETKERSRKPRETRGPGQKKRLAESEGATSSGIVLQPSHASKKDYTDQDIQSPAKRTKSNLQGTDAIDESGCSCGEDSSHAPTCFMSNLKLKDESAGKKDNVESSEAPGGCSSSAAGLEQYPKMDHLSVPVQSSGAQPTSPKKKGGLKGILCGAGETIKDSGKKFLGRFAASPKHSPDKKKSSSDKTDPNLMRRSPRFQQPNLNQGKTEASSSSSSPMSKRGDSSPDRSQPSTSSSDPNAERHKQAKKNPYKPKSRAEPSSASTSDDSQQKVTTLKVPSGGEGASSPRRRSRSRSPMPECDCGGNKSGFHKYGCSQIAWAERNKNARAHKLSTKPPGSKDYSSGTTSDPNSESSPTTKSKVALSKVSTGAEAGTSGCSLAPSTSNSPNHSYEAARSPNRRAPSVSPNRRAPSVSPNRRAPSVSRSTRSTRRTRQEECKCPLDKIVVGHHEEGCPHRSPS